jgi:hypothetical protein
VKNGMDTPLGWEFESYSNWRDNFGNFEGSVASWGQFGSPIW